ncbi:heat shock protein HtpX [Parelusimicrobium proximum]|uniref:M48 family metallopeptidase n=1 Tax=Parelusimicrobium proximum TaxID=3228953 RepID=UPI003D180463
MNQTTYNFMSDNKKRTWLIVLLFPITFAILAYITIFLASFFFTDTNIRTYKGPARNTVSVSEYSRQTRNAANYETAYSAKKNFDAANSLALYAIPILGLLAIIWVVVSYFKGDHMILSSAHAKEVTREGQPEIFRLVENLCITKGLPVPKIYLINDESLNAFATGRDPEHASIAMTTGIVAKLDKAELEGVIAHELAHVENRDIRLMLITIAGITFFTIVGEIIMHFAIYGRIKGKNSGAVRLALIVLAIMFLVYGYLIAPLIRLAMSRNREFLADATAAHTTRNPAALASALEKISGRSTVESLADRPSMAAMCIESPLKGGAGFFGVLSGLTATHPPIDKRVEALRAMDGTF